MSSASPKILACGSVDGKFSKFFKKISSIHKKNGPFEMVICAGNFFSNKPECKSDWEGFKKKKESINLPVYILGPTSPNLECFYGNGKIEDGIELCEDVIYLGKKGIFKTTSGLVIAYLSGSESTDSCGIKKAHVNALIDQVKRDDKYGGIDILITSTWPKDVTKHTPSKIVPDSSSASLSLLAATLKPRYHLSCHKTKFFERTPYRNHKVLNEQQQLVSRFISLAPFGNPEGEKALYALSLTPLSSMSYSEIVKQPDLVTEFPYKEVIDSILSGNAEDKPQQFFFDSSDSHKRKHDGSDGRSAKKTPKGPPTLKSDCWFCLGSKDVEKHLVISVGESCYVAIAKGAVNKDHILICPINHYNSTVVCPDNVVMEMEKYKMGLRKMFNEERKDMVTYERNFYTQHLQLQVIGIPSDCAGEIKDTFFDLADECSMDLMPVEEDKDIAEMVAVTTPYFAVELPSGERLLHKVKGKMPLQFGRDVLTSPSILNLPDRGDWKACKVAKEVEVEMAKKFRKRFQPYDFNFT